MTVLHSNSSRLRTYSFLWIAEVGCGTPSNKGLLLILNATCFSDSSVPLHLLIYISIWAPSSTTRLGGMPKNSVAGLALRVKNVNKILRHLGR